jgi:hypothetical protein
MVIGIAGLLTVGTFGTSSAGSTIDVTGGPPSCRVELQIGPSSATAVVLQGCTRGEYWLSSWATQSDVFATSHPQRLFDFSGPLDSPTEQLEVNLPNQSPCFFQVDFTKRLAAPGQPSAIHHHIVAYLGQTADCVSPTPTPSPTSSSPTPTPTPSPTSSSPTPTPSQTSASPSPSASVAGTSLSSPPVTPTPATQVAAESIAKSLPFTGFPTLTVLFAGILLVGVGAAVVRMSRGVPDRR